MRRQLTALGSIGAVTRAPDTAAKWPFSSWPSQNCAIGLRCESFQVRKKSFPKNKFLNLGLEQTFERKHRVTYPKYDFKMRLFNEVINRQQKVVSPPLLPPLQPRIQPPPTPPPPARVLMVPIIPHRICAVCSQPQYRVQLFQPRWGSNF